jgi:hypothetical protein
MKPRALNIFSFLALDRLIMTVNMPVRRQSDVSATRLSKGFAIANPLKITFSF